MINKQHVKAHFSRNAKSYDKYAQVQKKIAQKTFEHANIASVNSVLEIGSGTGELTRKVLPYVTDRYTCVDISEQMNAKLSAQLPNGILKVETHDIEMYRIVGTYNLILSSSTIQWVENKRDVLVRCLKAIEPKGKLVFSFFDHATFREFRELYSEISGHPFVGGPQLLTNVEIDQLVMALPYKISIEHEEICEPIQGLRSFFKELKAIGANNSSEVVSLKRSEWNELFNRYDAEIVREGVPYIRYGVTYLIIET